MLPGDPLLHAKWCVNHTNMDSVLMVVRGLVHTGNTALQAIAHCHQLQHAGITEAQQVGGSCCVPVHSGLQLCAWLLRSHLTVGGEGAGHTLSASSAGAKSRYSSINTTTPCKGSNTGSTPVNMQCIMVRMMVAASVSGLL